MPANDARAVSEVTRRNIFDELALGRIAWSGRLSEADFLARVFDLAGLPSNDRRASTMAGDIRLHRENFDDWGGAAWVFTDDRLDLLRGPDETVLRFLCETVHPIVRPDAGDAADLVALYNRHLGDDGFELTPAAEISGRTVYAARARLAGPAPSLAAAKGVAAELTSDHLSAQITRMETSLATDPAAAIGAAKEFVESVCKGVLAEREIDPAGKETLPQLVKATCAALGLSGAGDGREAARNTATALATLTQGVAELRGKLGTGHGQRPDAARPDPAFARLAVGAATSLGVFLFEVSRREGER